MTVAAGHPVRLDNRLRSRLCAALAEFRGSDDADEAALVQLWLPKSDDSGLLLLQTKVSCGSAHGYDRHFCSQWCPSLCTRPPPPSHPPRPPAVPLFVPCSTTMRHPCLSHQGLPTSPLESIGSRLHDRARKKETLR